jgi:hypothetical protein
MFLKDVTVDSSPEIAIITVTSTPRFIVRCVYNDTTVNAPKQPGVIPRKAAK